MRRAFRSGDGAFLRHAGGGILPDLGQRVRAADFYRAQPTQENLLEMQRVVAPPRQELFHRLDIGGGTATLVAIRRGVLSGLKAHPEWRVIDADLVRLFCSWFDPQAYGSSSGWSRLWHTPAIILEQLIHYEAVHENRQLDRVAPATGSRPPLSSAFFHPGTPRGSRSFSSRWR